MISEDAKGCQGCYLTSEMPYNVQGCHTTSMGCPWMSHNLCGYPTMSVLTIKGTHCVHILAAGCTYSNTCAPGVCNPFLTYRYLHIMKIKRPNCRVQDFVYLMALDPKNWHSGMAIS